jgi:hypothetical protein
MFALISIPLILGIAASEWLSCIGLGDGHVEMAQQLARTLVESLIKASQQTRATPEPVTEPTDKFDDWSDRLSLNNPSRFRS